MQPQHVAFIMDGNRRWARNRLLPSVYGHKKGVDAFVATVNHAIERKIACVTFWAFSTENWKREVSEVEDLLSVLRDVFASNQLQKIKENNARIVTIGDLCKFPNDIQQSIQHCQQETKNNTGITVTIALNYGGRAELLRAINTLLQEQREDIDERIFATYLDTRDIPDPDLLIRTGGEKRLSGYLPWQSVYSELYFTDTFWPDFTPEAFDKALDDYASRQRRFGA